MFEQTGRERRTYFTPRRKCMRTATIFTLAALALVPRPAVAQERRSPLEGKWRCLRVDDKGVLDPRSAGEVMTIANGKVTWTAGGPGAIDGGPFFIDPNANPPRMDINHGVGIYRMDADTLVVCWWANASMIQNTFDLPNQNPRAIVFTFRRIND
jgi:uncharacterized protein (TIGR03067 family)